MLSSGLEKRGGKGRLGGAIKETKNLGATHKIELLIYKEWGRGQKFVFFFFLHLFIIIYFLFFLNT